MSYAPEEYTKHYIIQALFKLMNEYEYEKISVTDVTEKAGVGRATFYRHFKNKEDVIIYFFDHNKREFIFRQRFYPRCREDYIRVVQDVFTKFKEEKEPLRLIRKAHLEYIYLEYLNKNFIQMFREEYPDKSEYQPLGYAGILFNISMAWLDNDCADDIKNLSEIVINTIYPNEQK